MGAQKNFYIKQAPKNDYGIIGQICEWRQDELNELEFLSMINGPIAAVEEEIIKRIKKPFYEYRSKYTNS